MKKTDKRRESDKRTGPEILKVTSTGEDRNRKSDVTRTRTPSATETGL